MYHVVFAQIMQADREREIEAAIRRRRLLKPEDESVEPLEATVSRSGPGRTLAPRVRRGTIR